jgi:hypothetical protein
LYFVYTTYTPKESFTCKDKSIIEQCVQEFKEDTCPPPGSSDREKCMAKYDVCGTYPDGCYQSYGVGDASDTKLAKVQGVGNKNLCEPLCKSINDCCFAKSSSESIFSS